MDSQGALVLDTPGGPVRFHRLVIYQNIAGTRREVAGGYVLTAPHQVGFQVAAYEATEPLIIDPVLSYSTYLGGSGIDTTTGIAVDGSGQAYVVGGTNSDDFPVTAHAFRRMHDSSDDGFVAQLSFPIPRWGGMTVIEIETSRGSSQRNPSTGHYLEQVTLTNIITTPIRGLFALVVDHLSANTTVVNPSGKTAWDEPYLELKYPEGR